MTPLETLVLVLGVPFFIIEISQLIQLVRSQKKLTSIWERVLEDPDYAGAVVANAVDGWLKKFKEDPESQEAFFGFIQACGVHAVEGVRAHLGKKGEITPDINLPKRHPMKPLEGIINMIMPNVIDKAQKAASNKAATAVEESIAGW